MRLPPPLRRLALRPLALAVATGLGFAPGIASCKDETHPVDVPFDGIDPVAVRKKAAPAPSADSAAAPSSTSSAEVPSTHVGGHVPSQGIEACCAALRAGIPTARDDAARRSLTSAAAACETQRKQLEQGKVNRTQALIAVRLSLIDIAPSACR